MDENMREKLKNVSLKDLRVMAKNLGLKSTTALRKEQLIERILEANEGSSSAEVENSSESLSVGDNELEKETPEVNSDMNSEERSTSGNNRNEYARRDGNPRTRRVQNQGQSGTSRDGQSGNQNNGRDRADSYQNNGRDRADSYQNNSRDRADSYQNNSRDRADSYQNNGRDRADSYQNNGRDRADSYQNNNRDRADSYQYGNQDRSDEYQNNNRFANIESGNMANGILEVMNDGFGFIRSDNFMPGEDDVYVSPSQIRKFRLQTGDVITGTTRAKSATEKFSALLYVKSINGMQPEQAMRRMKFDDMTPIFPNERIHLERPGGSVAMRIVDLVSPIGKGQRGMIVSPPKAGKTTLLKDAAKSILRNNPEMHLIILLIDERPEEVTDIKETVKGKNVEVIYSTFDETPEHHRRVSEMVIERAKRLVEQKRDVMIFIDSITRLARAYNQVIPPSGRTLSGGLDPAALHMPKRFFGAARNMREGGSLTILATALVDTGSKMDDVVYEEFKGTGNMELILDRKLQERRVFPAIDLAKSGTRREDLLLDAEEQEAVHHMRKALIGMKAEEAGENILNMFAHTRSNRELVQKLKSQRIV